MTLLQHTCKFTVSSNRPFSCIQRYHMYILTPSIQFHLFQSPLKKTQACKSSRRLAAQNVFFAHISHMLLVGPSFHQQLTDYRNSQKKRMVPHFKAAMQWGRRGPARNRVSRSSDQVQTRIYGWWRQKNKMRTITRKRREWKGGKMESSERKN
jgi:hypothetical protein